MIAACTETPPAPADPASLAQVQPPRLLGETRPLAYVAGPVRERFQPFYGTDLGWTFAHEGDLWVMFGDTWGTFLANSIQPDADDALGKISLRDFPDGDSVDRWVAAHPATGRRAQPWHAQAPTLRVVVDARGAPLPMRPEIDGQSLTSGPGLTPMGGFSNAQSGEAAAAFGLFLRNQPVSCDAQGSCADGFDCDAELGQCAPLTDVSAPCVMGTTTCRCVRVGTGRGLCQDRSSSVYDGSSERGRSHAVVMRQVVGNALHGADTTFVGRAWDTRRFYNMTVRSVNDFDPERAGDASTDYALASGQGTRSGVFVWGRPNFGGPRALGRDAQLYLAWVPMPNYDPTGHFAWEPRFFAGLDEAGRPRFVPREVDAAPLDLDASLPGEQPEEQEDMVGQMSISWVPSWKRFVMIYGGGIGTRLTALIFGADASAMQRDPYRSLYIRFAEHPWGPWTPPQVLLSSGSPENGQLGWYGPGGLLFHGRCVGVTCAPPELAFFGQAGEWGGFYAPSAIEQWTEPREGGAIDLYWHVSTWNPYQVVLMKTRLPAPDGVAAIGQ